VVDPLKTATMSAAAPVAEPSSRPVHRSQSSRHTSHRPSADTSVRRSESKDRPNHAPQVTRSSSRSRSDRYATAPNGMPSDSHQTAPRQTVARKRTSVTCSTGTWMLGKTIGQGSMGKVKLAKNQETGEQVIALLFLSYFVNC
jgi:hypothetical protein